MHWLISLHLSTVAARITSAHSRSPLALAPISWWQASSNITTITTLSWSRRWPIAWPRLLPNPCTSKSATNGVMAANENLSNEDLIDEKYRGIRPAPGYPACPDHTEKRTLFDLARTPKSQPALSLTESFAMLPAAAVSGWYFAHPRSRYFAVDRITAIRWKIMPSGRE